MRVCLGLQIAQRNQENITDIPNNFNDFKNFTHFIPFEHCSNCWICEGWSEVKFFMPTSASSFLF